MVSFYFGARHQLKGQQFQREIAETLARSPAAEPAPGLEARSEAHPEAHSEAEPNPALDDWRFSR